MEKKCLKNGNYTAVDMRIMAAARLTAGTLNLEMPLERALIEGVLA